MTVTVPQLSGEACALSLYEEASREAERHKWIESQKHGFDLGEHAVFDWYDHHWLRYCRVKRLEHLRGEQRWREYEPERFGTLSDWRHTQDHLKRWVLECVSNFIENLDIINWAFDRGYPTNRVIELLEKIDVNCARLEPRILCHAG